MGINGKCRAELKMRKGVSIMTPRKIIVYLLVGSIMLTLARGLLLADGTVATDECGQGQIRLLARGDDIGSCHAANVACIKAYREGIMTSVEVMVPPPWFEEAAKMLRENPGLDVGIHLTLNSEWEGYKWGPVLGKSAVPSLVNKDGFFYSQKSLREGFPPGMSFTEADPKIEEVEKELRAQIELALKKIPQVSHLSNHMGTSTCTPELRAMVEKLSKEYNLPLGAPGLKRVGRWGGQVIPNKEAAFIEILENLTPGTYIFVVHPGLDVPEMQALWHIGYRGIGARRAADTAMFTSQKVKDVIKKRGIKLISYADLYSELKKCRQSQDTDLTKAVSDSWRLAIQAWTFRRFTFFEAVDKTASLGLGYIEAYPNQKISKEIDLTFENITAAAKQQVKRKLAQAGVRLVNYGMVGLPNNEAGCRAVFDFARDMGIETIVSEPGPEAFDLIEKLCEEYKIKVAIHNHPKPTRYWNPDTVLEVCRGRSKWIGACADTGHWMRSGVNPVEALRKLQGRIISLHLKDLNKFGVRRAHDVPWGSGKGDVKAMLAELDRQNFSGVFSVEYEYNWENSVPEIRQCVEYFKKTAEELNRTVR